MAVVKQQTHDYETKLNQLNQEVQSLKDQLMQAQRLASVGTMTAMIAHEFNNILTPIINYAQLAQQNPKLSDKAITKAASGGQRATTICQAILDITRGNVSESQEVNVNALICETLEAMAREPKKDLIDLCIDVDPKLTITTRKVEIQQVILNLVLNARNALLAKGKGGVRRINLSAGIQNDNFVIKIQDTGVGIAKENLQQIFHPFYTTQNSENKPKGHGLGLALCKNIIQSMEGAISVESEPGQGTTFTITIPV